MDKYSYLSNADGAAVEALYNDYLKDPSSVSQDWARFFEGFEFARKNFESTGEVPENFQKEFKVMKLIEGYRTRGHLFTKTNPVRTRRTYSPTLDIENFGLEKSDLDTVFQAGTTIGIGAASLKDIVHHLEESYCRTIGVEFMYVRTPAITEWIKDKIHQNNNQPKYSAEDKKLILKKLVEAVSFEEYLHKKFVGQKRFSLQGGETLIPAMEVLVEKGAELGVEEFIFGMAHRGRLNILGNIFHKSPRDIFNEFEGKEFEEDGLFDGDVKYHMGYSCERETTTGKKVHMTLAPNPSHLEAVDPIVEGITRSKIDTYLKDDSKVVPILIHGDAAIAGQGIVYEVIQMAQLDGYKNGGTIHVVINNQVGFTTNYLDARSSTYCTDVAKTTLSPVFHVNGDDAEAVAHVMSIAMQFRQEFKRDVFVDLLCYRKYGHNEGDEPRFTQPLLYKAIAKHPNPKEIYAKELIEEGIVKEEDVKAIEKRYNETLDNNYEAFQEDEKTKVIKFLKYTWRNNDYAKEGDFDQSPETGYDLKKLKKLAIALNTLPEGKKWMKKVGKIFDDRIKMVNETNQLDWAMGELLAYATLLEEGHPVRISGQDVERGTFSHRHAVVKVEDSEEEYTPLNHLSDKQAPFYIYNSLLSEYAVLGFEYGYGMATPNGLTVWEAQFGDFGNGAQIIIDQFISSGEDKWKTMNGLVMMMPHGYEGQGAEHSSARLERFLQLCGQKNMQVVNVTTPANYFHVLRRQLHRPFRKPLIVMTPKKLLRYPSCVSKLEEMASGRFQEIIDDTQVKKDKATRLVLCSGKIYYDLIEKREEAGDNSTAIVRVEQLYPFAFKQFDELLANYKSVKQVLWVQEEPENMGAWSYILNTLRKKVDIDVIARKVAASPAPGSYKADAARQNAIFEQLFSKVEVTN